MAFSACKGPFPQTGPCEWRPPPPRGPQPTAVSSARRAGAPRRPARPGQARPGRPRPGPSKHRRGTTPKPARPRAHPAPRCACVRARPAAATHGVPEARPAGSGLPSAPPCSGPVPPPRCLLPRVPGETATAAARFRPALRQRSPGGAVGTGTGSGTGDPLVPAARWRLDGAGGAGGGCPQRSGDRLY